jgi:2Fe-2S ferredoxin
MKATWILPDGATITADVVEGRSLMEAAVANNVPGVIGECGGTMSCATCHVHVDDKWAGLAGTVSSFEDAMLDIADGDRVPNSRLSCQITMSQMLDGIVLRVPEKG